MTNPSPRHRRGEPPAIQIRPSNEVLKTPVRQGLTGKLGSTNRTLVDEFIKAHWPSGLTADGQKKIKRYDRIYAKWKETQGDDPDSSEDEAGTQFALEEHLRDYLADNLGDVEPGLTPWLPDGDAVEFKVDEQAAGRRVDILAKDSEGVPVVMELKVSKGHERAIGQALYYRARLKKLLKVDRVRIFIVAAEVSPELRAAASEVPDVSLFEYKLAMTVKAITPWAA